MATSRKQSIAARLAKMPPDEAFREMETLSTPERKSLFADLAKPEFRKLQGRLEARLFAKSLKEAVEQGVMRE